MSLLCFYASFPFSTCHLRMRSRSNQRDGCRSLDGYIHDERGGSIATAAVTARNTSTNQQFSTKTNDAGYFRFPLLQIGEYEVSASAAGFSVYRQSGLNLRVGQQARLDVVLKLSTAAETITVHADIGMVEAGGQTAQGEVLNATAMRSLPVTVEQPREIARAHR